MKYIFIYVSIQYKYIYIDIIEIIKNIFDILNIWKLYIFNNSLYIRWEYIKSESIQ